MAVSYNEQSYSGEQQLEPFIKPHLLDKALADYGITIETTKHSAYEWGFIEVGDSYIYPYVDGFQGGASGLLSSKKVALVEFKKEMAISAQKYRQRIQRLFTKQGGVNNDMTGEQMFKIESELHMKGVKSGIYKHIWVGDKNKVHATAGTYPNGVSYAAGDPDVRYNSINGFWTEAIARQASQNIPLVQLTGANANTTLVNNGQLQTDAAKVILKEVYDNASPELQLLYDEGEAYFYCTKNIINNYRESLESDGTEAAHNKTIFGIPRMMFRGLPLIDMRLDGVLSADFQDESKFRVMLTTPDNLRAVLGLGSDTQTRFWFNPDANENRQRTQFEMECTYMSDKYLSLAY